MPSRRQYLRGATLSSLAIAGCLGQFGTRRELGTLTPSATPTGEEPTSTDPTAQFQYDSGNSGISDSAAPETNTVLWRTTVPEGAEGISVADGRALVATRGDVYALDASDGTTIWKAERIGHSVEAAPALSGDTAYVPTWNGGEGAVRGIVALDLADGRTRWRTIPDVDVSVSPKLDDGTLYVGGSVNSEYVIALDATTGEELWRYSTGESATTPAIANGVVFAGDRSRPVVYALDATDGEKLWQFDTDGNVRAPPTVVGGTMYVVSRNGIVYALDPETGDEWWRLDVSSDDYWERERWEGRASIAATSDGVFVPGSSLTALSTDGKERWSVDVHTTAFAPTITERGIVVSDRQEVICFEAEDGAARWRHEVGSRARGDAGYGGMECEPVVTDGSVYVASFSGYVYALDDADG